jgi:hypothetical protein
MILWLMCIALKNHHDSYTRDLHLNPDFTCRPASTRLSALIDLIYDISDNTGNVV